MKLKDGRISILFQGDYQREGMIIELCDMEAAIHFASIKLTPEQVCQAFSRRGMTECEIELLSLDKVGKKHEHRSFEFELPDCKGEGRKAVAARVALRECPDGWEPDLTFNSQESFFQGKDDKQMARTIIRRWVNPERTDSEEPLSPTTS